MRSKILLTAMDERHEMDHLDLVTNDDHSSALAKLFDLAMGEWVDIAELPGISDLKQGRIFVTWLDEPPDETTDFRIVLFVDGESGLTQVTHYNFTRLFG